MKQVLFSFAAVLTAIVTSFSAQADVTGPAWSCDLNAKAAGQSISILVSFTDIAGPGTLLCYRPDGLLATVPVRVHLGGLGVGFGISTITNLQVYTLNVGVTEIEQMLGEFTAGVGGDVTFINGSGGFQIGLTGANGLSFDLGLVGKQAQGLQLKAEGFVLTIEQTGQIKTSPWPKN